MRTESSVGCGLRSAAACSPRLHPFASKPPPRPSFLVFSSLRFPPLRIPRLQASCRRGRALRAVICSNGTSTPGSGHQLFDDDESSSKEAIIDIKLPRRSLLVQFTCDACGERTQRLINRRAYERGTVFLQCGGCLVYHKFVDNLGLVVEYDLREELDVDTDIAM